MNLKTKKYLNIQKYASENHIFASMDVKSHNIGKICFKMGHDGSLSYESSSLNF